MKKTWFNRYAQLRGEWWIIDGQAVFADSNVVDVSHESYVIMSIQRQYAYDKFDNEDWVDWDAFKKQLARESFEEDNEEKLSDSEWERWSKSLDLKSLYLPKLQELGMSDKEINLADGHGDARAYGLEHLGWKRIQGNNVQTQNLTREDLTTIANGLWDAYQEDAPEEKFNIEVMSSRTIFENVPYEDIEQGNPSELILYRTKY